MDVTLLRGGTSKGVYVRLTDLPPDGRERDELVLGLLGSPDPMQLDGLGGTHSSTSKLMAVGTVDEARKLGYSVPDGFDIVSLFAQISINEPVVEWRGNCGNLTSGVPVFALHEGLAPTNDPISDVRLFNLNTQTPISARVPTRGGVPLDHGDFVLPGVPGTGARIDVTFHTPAADAKRPPLFPTDKRIQKLTTPWGSVEATIIHVNNPFVFIHPDAVGISGNELPTALNSDRDLIDRLELIRGEAAVQLGLAPRAEDAKNTSPAIPRVVIVTEPNAHTTVAGVAVKPADCDVVARMTSMGPVHHALSGTGCVVTAVASLVEGTLASHVADVSAPPDVRIAHPKGIVTAAVKVVEREGGAVLESVTLPRTARRLMKGEAFPSPTARGLL